jgi:predicted metal-dependent enzyme (double-stranded beta helix superfamily)
MNSPLIESPQLTRTEHARGPAHASMSFELSRATLIARIRAAWLDPASPIRDRHLCRALIDFCSDSALPDCINTTDPHRYRRIELQRDTQQGWRLLALVWAPGQSSSIHNHGGRSTHEAVWSGELQVQDFESTPLADGRVLLSLLADDAFEAPDARASPRFHEDIHRCSNVTGTPCILLQLFPINAPPQSEYRLSSDGAFEIHPAPAERLEFIND